MTWKEEHQLPNWHGHTYLCPTCGKTLTWLEVVVERCKACHKKTIPKKVMGFRL